MAARSFSEIKTELQKLQGQIEALQQNITNFEEELKSSGVSLKQRLQLLRVDKLCLHDMLESQNALRRTCASVCSEWVFYYRSHCCLLSVFLHRSSFSFQSSSSGACTAECCLAK